MNDRGGPGAEELSPPTPSLNNRGPNVELEFICTVHVEGFASFHIHASLNEHFLAILRSRIYTIKTADVIKVNTRTELTTMRCVDDVLDV